MNKPVPTIGLVSLGCPKALVDTERIMTQLRPKDMCSPAITGRRHRDRQHLRLPRQRQAGILAAIGEAIAENGRVIVTGCMGVEASRSARRIRGVLAVTGPHQYEAVVEAVHDAAAAVHDPYVDLVPPQGLKLTPRHYAYLKISEGCNNRCSFCIIPAVARRSREPAGRRLGEAERLVKAGRQRAACDPPGYQRLWARPQVRREQISKAAMCARNSSISARSSASSAPGSDCTTSTLTRMSMR